ncbi:MAG: RyR domain-containing protein [Acidobacteriota bacterium]
MTYTPSPIDTTDIVLPPSLEELVERLSANNHDNWAAERTAEGRKFGSKRDDVAKTHPDLVPYEQLSESEKQYDRVFVIETLKAMIALGYRIEERT